MKRFFIAIFAAVMLSSGSLAIAAQSGVAPQAKVESAEPIEWLEVNLESAGSLGVEVLYKVNVLNDVQNLRVSGPMNSADWSAISNMNNLANLDLSAASVTSVPKEQFKGRTKLQLVILPETLKSIDTYAFSGTSISSVVVPASVTSVGTYCFYNCKSLETLVWESKSTIAERAFFECNKLTNVSISEGVYEIQDYAFYNCDLTTVNLPETLVSIDRWTFYGNRNLAEIVFPEGLKTIGHNAFAYCGLKKAELPQKLSSIGSGAFQNCSNLEEVTLPSGISAYNTSSSNYYDGIFYECRKIKKVTCYAATPPAVLVSTFYGVDRGQATLIVPTFAIADYKLADIWTEFGSIQGGITSNHWDVFGKLSLTNNRRMEGTPSVNVYTTGSLTVGGEAPMPMDKFTINENLYNANYGMLINNSPAMTANAADLELYIGSNRWYFISVPCELRVSDIEYNGDFVIRYYDGAARAQVNGTGLSWKNVDAEGVLEPGKAYILQGSKEGWINFHATTDGVATLLASGDRSVPVAANPCENAYNAGWNFVGNPYLSYYDMAATSLTCPITVWDGSKYVAYSLIDDDVVLRPTQAFFIQQSESDGEIVFGAEGRQLTTEISRPASVRAASAWTDRRLFNILIDGNDRARVVINEDASELYELSRDASKFFTPDGDAAAIYTIDTDGNRLSINERPMTDGSVQLGIYVPAAGTHTISADDIAGEAVLHDALLDTDTMLGNGRSHTFEAAEAGYCDDRFSLTLKMGTDAADNIASDIADNINVTGGIGSIMVEGAEGLTVSVAAVDGRVVATVNNAAACQTIELSAGIYIVKAGAHSFKSVVR